MRHCELNPIELVWAQVKGFVARNTTFKLQDVISLTHAGFAGITKDVWVACEDHVIAIEESYWISDCVAARTVPPVVIQIDSDDDESSDD